MINNNFKLIYLTKIFDLNKNISCHSMKKLEEEFSKLKTPQRNDAIVNIVNLHTLLLKEKTKNVENTNPPPPMVIQSSPKTSILNNNASLISKTPSRSHNNAHSLSNTPSHRYIYHYLINLIINLHAKMRKILYLVI